MLDITKIPFDDKETWDMIGEGRVKGCFQIESFLGKTWCIKLKPRNIGELSDLIALIRPGCVSGDSSVITSVRRSGGRINIKRSKMRDLFNNKKSHKTITSINEDGFSFVDNGVIDIFYSGQKECFKIKIRKYSLGQSNPNRRSVDQRFFDLECTDDHMILTPNGWVELKDLKLGDRIASIKRVGSQKRKKDFIKSRHHSSVEVKNCDNSKYYSEICYKNYEEKCVICGWNKTTLDTHHIDGDRYKDNSKENLAFLCPNHHREYNNGLISKDQIILSRESNKLPESNDLIWVTYLGKESVGIKDTYDIAMNDPHNSFIAGNIVVHNCLMASSGGKSMTQVYCDRKHNLEGIASLHPSIDDVLKETFGVIVYQEQSMKIAEKMAGFNLKEADDLRKAIGKKKADLMKEIRGKFISGCISRGINEDKAIEVFDIIEKSNRYSFNKSHSVSYAVMAYWSAYLKIHHPKEFYTNWLREAEEKIDPDMEKKELILSAKSDKIETFGPHYTKLEENFFWDDESNGIRYGICNVKSVGKLHLDQLREYLIEPPTTWIEMLLKVLLNVNKKAVENLIKVGAFSGLKKSRTEMLHEFSCISDLTDKELLAFIAHINNSHSLLDNLVSFTNAGLKKNGGYISSEKRLEKIHAIIDRLKNPGRDLGDNPVIYSGVERQLLGHSIYNSEIGASADAIYADTSCMDINNGKFIKSTLAVVLKRIRIHTTKKGEDMAFLSVEDDSGILENVVVFTELYGQNKDIIYEDAMVLITGEIKDKSRKSFIVESIYLI